MKSFKYILSKLFPISISERLYESYKPGFFMFIKFYIKD